MQSKVHLCGRPFVGLLLLVVLSTPVGAQTLSVSPTSGTQLTTFTVTGSGYTPNGTINRFVQIPGQAFQQIGAITATASGTITTQWPFTPGCSYPTGTAYSYAVDVSTGRTSPTISEQITADASCQPLTLSVS